LEISKVITERLKASGQRYFACDNVSDFMSDEERGMLILELTNKFNTVLDAMIIDRNNDPNSMDTGKRLAKMYVNELLKGRFYPAPASTSFPNDGATPYAGMLVVRADIKSLCSHHWKDVNGTAYIGIIPGKNVIGLSKYIRIAQHVARRGTLQEELCTAINAAIRDATGSEDVGVHIAATHGCVSCRGVMQDNSLTQTTVLNGRFYEQPIKQEFYENIKMQLMIK
jgi:GTP cyclohydrolase I